MRSAEIEHLVKASFDVVGDWNWGGTLNHLVVQNIAENFDKENRAPPFDRRTSHPSRERSHSRGSPPERLQGIRRTAQAMIGRPSLKLAVVHSSILHASMSPLRMRAIIMVSLFNQGHAGHRSRRGRKIRFQLGSLGPASRAHQLCHPRYIAAVSAALVLGKLPTSARIPIEPF